MSMPASSKQQRTWEGREELHQQLLGGIILTALDAIITIDFDRRIVLFNPAAEKMFKVSAEEAIGQPLDRFIPDSLRITHRGEAGEPGHNGETARLTGSLGVVKGLRANGEEFPAETAISQAEAGGLKFYTAIVRDISERIRTEQLLRESGHRLRLAVDTARLGTYERDLIKNEVRLNDACREILGLPEGPLPPDIARRSAHPDDMERVMAAVARAFDPELREICAAEFRILRADGTFRWVAGRGRVVFDESVTPARPQKFLGVLLDITERKLAEAETLRAKQELTVDNAALEQRVRERTIRLQEAIAELEHMSYSMIHDMRAPLRAIQSFGAILQQVPQIRFNDQVHQLLTKMRTAALRMDQLLTGALNYNEAVRNPLPLVQADVQKLLRDLVAMHLEFQPPHAEVSVDGPFPRVLGNEPGLVQCFGELIRNAVKFVEPGKIPRIRVWASQTQEPNQARFLEEPPSPHNIAAGTPSDFNGGWVRLYFQDNGTGIPESGHRRIFDMFQRLHGPEYPGTGIGLALVRKVIEHMGGRIGFESKEGKGSCFWLDLPQPPRSKRTLAYQEAT